MRNSKASVDAFLEQTHIGLAGYSRHPKKFGFLVYKTLKEKGYTVHPVNPAGGTTPEGTPIHPDVGSLPGEVRALLVVTRPEVTPAVVDQALERGFGHLWIQQMSGSKDLRSRLEKEEINVVYDRCVLMHAHPTGIHKWHRWILSVFGRLPK
jgi:hypothetical protein